MRAPEIVLGLPVGKGVDIWAFGCLLYEFLLGGLLFSGLQGNGSDEFTNDGHLIQMSEIIGQLPPEYVSNWRRRDRYFGSDGKRVDVFPDESGIVFPEDDVYMTENENDSLISDEYSDDEEDGGEEEEPTTSEKGKAVEARNPSKCEDNEMPEDDSGTLGSQEEDDIDVDREHLSNYSGGSDLLADPTQFDPLEKKFRENKPDTIDEAEEKEIVGLLRWILRFDASQRPSAADILNHSWFEI